MLVPGSGGVTGWRCAAQDFGADAVLTGWSGAGRQREGGPSGSRRPASVWFVLELARPRRARCIWNGTYEETQPPLSEDLCSLSRAWERGFRWVTAEELAELRRARAGRTTWREETGPWS